MSDDYIEEFRAAMSASGLKWLGPISDDGKVHRFKAEGSKDASAWYSLHPPPPLAAGAFGCWRTQQDHIRWSQKNGQKYSKEEWADFQRKWAETERQRAIDEKERHERMAVSAAEYVKAQKPAGPSHLYFQTKAVLPHGPVSQNDQGDLVVPLQDISGKAWSYQTIDCLGDKLFMPGGRVAGCYFPICDKPEGPLVICEGYATGASIHQATGYAVYCAMNCGNLLAVALACREKWKDRLIVIGADNDRFTTKQGEPHNPGLEKATAAAQKVKGSLVVPSFLDTDLRSTDFNDLMALSGIGAVRVQFDAVLGLGMGKRITIKQLLSFVPSEDKNSMLGNRYLCRGGSCVIVGSTSAGKSSLGMQMAVMFALGLPFFGLKPAHPLKSVYVQAENDEGDVADFFQGILLGLGLVDDGNPEGNNELVRVLEKNLIIIRDQTHTGVSFPSYAQKTIELYQPDLFWVDPMLSFYGDDINDQRAMSQFLRAGLNPISESTGVIWMLLHHTGKPSKDATKAQKNWSSRDFSYMGIGSSELSNWARAIICLTATSEDEFRMIFAKRGWRAGLMDGQTPVTELSLAYGTDHIYWRQIPKPKDEEDMQDQLMAFALTVNGAQKATAIVKLAADKLKRGLRTCWNLWGNGAGELGKYFVEVEGGLYKCRKSAETVPYRDD